MFNQKRFYTRKAVRGILISPLAEIFPVYIYWLRWETGKNTSVVLMQDRLLNLCSHFENIKGYFIVKKLVRNVRIKDFWCTKDNKQADPALLISWISGKIWRTILT